jgi:hypothetical protein
LSAPVSGSVASFGAVAIAASVVWARPAAPAAGRAGGVVGLSGSRVAGSDDANHDQHIIDGGTTLAGEPSSQLPSADV